MIRRGEGGAAGRGGPLWSPVVARNQSNFVGSGTWVDAGDHKGPPNLSVPPSPLRIWLTLMLNRRNS